MNESRLLYLFKVHFNQSATPQEQDEFFALLSDPGNDEQLKKMLSETWQRFDSNRQLFDDSDSEKMLANILEKATTDKSAPITYSPANTSKLRRSIAVAAVIVFVFTGIYFLLTNRSSLEKFAQSQKISPPSRDSILPGGNKATLTLADGSSIVLDSNKAGVLTNQGNAKVINLNTAVLTYNNSDQHENEIVYNTLSTSNGGQYQLVLSDGTKVWLNAFSSIHFPTIFEGRERKVTVTGEAYFEVARNAAMPFIINVKGVEVKVLGTHFNVMAYDDENSLNTTLIEGSVKISNGKMSKMLAPGQESRITQSGEIKITEADIEEVLAWKNGWFQFSAYDIKKVMRQVSRWYNVEVVYEGKIMAGHFTGMVSRENSIEQVLKIMEAGDVKFKIEGRKIVVY